MPLPLPLSVVVTACVSSLLSQELRSLLQSGRYALTGQRHWGHAFDLELRRRKTALFYLLLRSPLFDRYHPPYPS